MFEAKHVSWFYPDGYQALKDINLFLERGECAGLVGANGAGKSTLLRLFAGIETGGEGRIQLDGMEYSPKNQLLLRRRIGYVFQNPDDQVFMPTVYDDVAFGIRNFGLEEAQVECRVAAVLAQLNIGGLKKCPVHKLSGGQKRSVALAGVLVMDPEIVFFDEPTAFLDIKGRRAFVEIMKTLGRTSILATHDLELVLELCPRVMVMAGGRLMADGPAEQLLSRGDFMAAAELEVPASLR